MRERATEGAHFFVHSCLQPLLSYAHIIVCQHTTVSFFFCDGKKKGRRREKTIPPCTFLLLLVKWNTYIRHHCGLHKCLKVINISSSVRLMCLVIGYLCCGLPLSKPPLHFGICVHVCVCVNGVAMCTCVRAFMHTTMCVCVCMLAFVFLARNVPCLCVCVCVPSLLLLLQLS